MDPAHMDQVPDHLLACDDPIDCIPGCGDAYGQAEGVVHPLLSIVHRLQRQADAAERHRPPALLPEVLTQRPQVS